MTDLDRQIAVDVMKQQLCRCPKPHVGWDPHECLKCGVVVDMAYSTDIAAAWQVVEKTARDGCCPDINYHPRVDMITGEPMGPWHCAMRVGRQWVHSHAETAPEAICLAALEAVKK
jgi:hypothetical protein